MDPWLVAVAAILAMVAIGTIVARRREADGPRRSLAALLAARSIVVVLVTALVAVTKVEFGSLAAAAAGVVGVAVGLVILIRTGYAGSITTAR